jgi:NAD(P)-dependent dehydrogenase (short-subunit alcohol dehydrogenase family)
VALDVLDEAQAAAAVETALQRFGASIWWSTTMVVNNAGRGSLSAVEEASDAGNLSVSRIPQ